MTLVLSFLSTNKYYKSSMNIATVENVASENYAS